VQPRKKRDTFDPTFPGYVREIVLDRDKVGSFESWPFSLPVVRTFSSLKLHPKVTFLVGENGSGKSTIIEAVAQAMGMNVEGGSKNFRFSTRVHESPLGDFLKIVRGFEREKDTFFLRAESFYNVATEIERLDRIKPSFGKPLIDAYGGRSLHKQSHGESFFALFQRRFKGNGLYLLDEPEAALSPKRQLEFLAILHSYCNNGAQFVIATNSPLIMAYPNAWIYVLDGEAIRQVPYLETEHYLVSRGFLSNPQRTLNILFSDKHSD